MSECLEKDIVIPFSHMTLSELRCVMISTCMACDSIIRTPLLHNIRHDHLEERHMALHNVFCSSQQENFRGNEPINKITLKPDEVLLLGMAHSFYHNLYQGLPTLNCNGAQ